MERQQVQVGMALAIIHHIAISNNVPLDSISAFFAKLCQHLIIEFVPKSDSQVARLLTTREDVFPDYNQEGFEFAFSRHFKIRKSKAIENSERVMYLMEARPPVQ